MERPCLTPLPHLEPLDLSPHYLSSHMTGKLPLWFSATHLTHHISAKLPTALPKYLIVGLLQMHKNCIHLLILLNHSLSQLPQHKNQSLHPIPLLNPTCSSITHCSVTLWTQFLGTFAKCFPGMLSRLIPCSICTLSTFLMHWYNLWATLFAGFQPHTVIALHFISITACKQPPPSVHRQHGSAV